MTKTSQGFWAVGHRGSPTTEIENTMASFRRAIEHDRANGLEIDLSVTRDDAVVLWHDFAKDDWRARFRRWGLEPDVRYRPAISSTAKPHRTTRDLTLAELREYYGYSEKKGNRARLDAEIPTFEAFMEWASRERRLGLVFLDTKVTEDALELLPIILQRVDDCVARLAPRFRIVFETASEVVDRRLAELAPRHHRTLDVEPPAGFVWDLEACSAARAAIAGRHTFATAQKPRSITFSPFETHRRIVKADLARIREYNRAAPATAIECLCSFTINDEEEMRELIELGVSAIQSDRPDALVRVARAAGQDVGLCVTEPTV